MNSVAVIGTPAFPGTVASPQVPQLVPVLNGFQVVLAWSTPYVGVMNIQIDFNDVTQGDGWLGGWGTQLIGPGGGTVVATLSYTNLSLTDQYSLHVYLTPENNTAYFGTTTDWQHFVVDQTYMVKASASAPGVVPSSSSSGGVAASTGGGGGGGSPAGRISSSSSSSGAIAGLSGTTGQSNSSGGGSGLSGGAIAGIVIGSVVGVAVLLLLLWLMCVRGAGYKKDNFGSSGQTSKHSQLDEQSRVGAGGMEQSQVEMSAAQPQHDDGEDETA